MAAYFFDVDDGDRVILGDEGLEFAGPKEARDEATRLLLDLAKEALPLEGQRASVVRIRDQDARCICVVTLSLAAEWLSESAATAPDAAPASDEAP
jgi:hypothetical protein